MRVVILDDKSLQTGGESPWEQLSAVCEWKAYDGTPRELVIERSLDADILVVNKVVITEAILDRLPRLKCIAVSATGTNVVDSAAARKRGIPVCNTPAYGTDAVAQHVFALLLELCRRTSLHDASIRRGDWAKCGDFCYWLTPQIELTGRTFGVFGYGNLGRRVAEIAHAFRMNVIACSHSPKPLPGFSPFAFVSKEELFRQSDIITLHCPLTDETRGLVCKETLSLVKPGCILINTSRGGAVNGADTAEALKSGRLAAFAADVLEHEPPSPDDPLLAAPNTLFTPHLAWTTDNARRNIVSITIDNIRKFMEGTPQNAVNMKNER